MQVKIVKMLLLGFSSGSLIVRVLLLSFSLFRLFYHNSYFGVWPLISFCSSAPELVDILIDTGNYLLPKVC